MLGPFTFTFTLESEEFEKSEKVAAAAAGSLIDHDNHYSTRAPDGANKLNDDDIHVNISNMDLLKKANLKIHIMK